MKFKKPQVYGMFLARGIAAIADGVWAVFLCKILPEADHPQFEILLGAIALNLFNIVIVVLGNRIDPGVLRPMRMFALIGNGLFLVIVLLIGFLGIVLVSGGGTASGFAAAHSIAVWGIAGLLAIWLNLILIITLSKPPLADGLAAKPQDFLSE